MLLCFICFLCCVFLNIFLLLNRNTSPGRAVSETFQELCSLCESHLNGLPSVNIVLKDFNFASKIRSVENIEKSLESYTCVKCPEFLKHVSEFFYLFTCKHLLLFYSNTCIFVFKFEELSTYKQMEEDIKEYTYKLSEESLTFHPEYQMRKNVGESIVSLLLLYIIFVVNK